MSINRWGCLTVSWLACGHPDPTIDAHPTRRVRRGLSAPLVTIRSPTGGRDTRARRLRAHAGAFACALRGGDRGRDRDLPAHVRAADDRAGGLHRGHGPAPGPGQVRLVPGAGPRLPV